MPALSWLPDTAIKAIVWMLIHSLWQGLILAVVAAIIIVLTRRSSSLRYFFLCVAFILFILTCFATFFNELRPFTNGQAFIRTTISQKTSPLFTGQVFQDYQSIGWVNRVSAYLDEHASVIAGIWLIIFMIKFSLLVANITRIQILRNRRSFPAPDWQEKVTEFARRIKISKPVLLLESAMIKVPTVIGFMKPAILVPFGWLSSLPADQVEAILLHELAHIRRKDYLVNLIQCFGETIFFFNPAVLWLSSLIRQERENCCDDIAISITRKKSTFIRALLAFHENNAAIPSYAPAFPGRKQQLLERAKRIVYSNNKNLNNMEKFFLASGLVVTGLVVLSFSVTHAGNRNHDQSPGKSAQQHDLAASPARATHRSANLADTIVAVINERSYRLERKNGIITALYVEGQKVPNEKITSYKQITDKMITTPVVSIETENAKLGHVSGDKPVEPALNAQMSSQQQEMLEKTSQKATIESENKKISQYEAANRPKNNTNDPQMEWARKHEEMLKSGKQPEMSEQQQEALRKQEKIAGMKTKISAAQVESLLNDITSDLLKDKLIQDNKSVFFQLNTEVLIVNDIKQSNALQQKFRNKYLKSSEDHIVFQKKDGGAAITDIYID